MPELPEVETVRLQLRHKVANKKIKAVEVFHSKTVAHNEHIEEQLVGKTIDDIGRIGKLMIFSFVGEDDLFLLAHLKMTGQFFYVDESGEIAGGGHTMTAADLDLPMKHTRLALHFTDKSTLYFNDMRLFGYVKTATAAETNEARDKFGPEPIADDFDCQWFAERLKRRKTNIKAVLLDQKFVAGLGNIYVDEALWYAKVHPTRRADQVTKAEAAVLCKAAGDVMKESIKVGGTTFQYFIDTEGQVGNYKDKLQVFAKQGTPCPRCKTEIRKTRVAGRGTHFCPKCQK